MLKTTDFCFCDCDVQLPQRRGNVCKLGRHHQFSLRAEDLISLFESAARHVGEKSQQTQMLLCYSSRLAVLRRHLIGKSEKNKGGVKKK